MRKIRIWTGLLAAGAVLLASCTSVPLTSLPKLASLQSADFRPSEVEIAVRMEDAFRVSPGGARLSFKLANDAAGVDREEAFVLLPVGGTPTPVLRKAEKRGFGVHRFRLAPADGARLESLIQQAKDLRARKAGKSSMSVNAGASLCQPMGARSQPSARMTLFLKVDAREDFFVLINETKIDFKGAGAAAMKSCEGEAR